MENVFHWSKFKACSHDIFFSWTFDLLLFSSNKYLLFGVYFSLHQWNIVHKYKRQPVIKRDTNRYTFSLSSDTNVEKSYFFHVELKFLISNFLFFSVSWTHSLKVIKQPFRRGLNLINVVIIFSSQHHLETSFDV